MAFTREELEREGLTDFRVFLTHVWAFLGLPPPTKTQYDIARWLQKGPRRAVLQAFRGVGKSWITVAFVLWVLLLDPQKKIMVVSASQQLADDFSKFCKQLILGMPLLNHLAPRTDQRNSAVSFDVGPATPSKDPSVKSVGITGQLTGSRADVIVADDIEVPKNSYTHLLRERLAELVKEFDSVLKPEKDARILYLGTPQIEASLYNRLIRERGYVARIWPAQVPDNPAHYHGLLAPFVQKMIDLGAAAGTPVDPARFGDADLMERRVSYGLSGYALQFMLDTTPSDADRHPLKLRDLIVHDVDPQLGHVKLVWGGSNDLIIQDLPAGGLEGDAYHRPAWRSPEMAAYTGTVMAIDPSGTGSDETAYAVLKYLHGMLYLVASGGFVQGFKESTLAELAGIALRHGVNDIIVEKNFGSGMFDELLKPHLQRAFASAHDGKLGSAGRIDEEWKGWSRGQKELRICDTLEPVLNSHRLCVDRRVLEEDSKQQHDGSQYSLIQQLTRISRVRGALPHDDRVEALSMAVSYYTERMARDQDRAVEQHKASLLDAELKRFKQHVFSVGRKPTTGLSRLLAGRKPRRNFG